MSAAHAALPRTDWFTPETDPTIPGTYECTTLANEKGHVFPRRWDGEQWVNSVTGLPTKVRMFWRGVAPGGVPVEQYPASVRVLIWSPPLLQDAKVANLVNPVRARAAKALYDETMATP